MWRRLSVVVVAGCGRLSFEPVGEVAADAAADVGAVVDAATRSPCPADYVELMPGDLDRYKFIATTQSWSTQQLACANDGAYLAIPDAQAELDALVARGDVWLGISDTATEGTFVTVLGALALFLPWASTQPDDFNMNEDCVIGLSAGGRLNDLPCPARHLAYCECNPIAL